ncbi:MAG: hypothetical protein OXJ53_05375 [Gammaproteobacteria bacterium]|nr:hypothetical protein [Gammaproteobacteria bacterium]MDD9961455.1 hypothetical protein [Gammaproteobacteria bacterium]
MPGKLAIIDECASRAQGFWRLIGTGCGMDVRAEQDLRETESQHGQPSGGTAAQRTLAKWDRCACGAEHAAASAP